MENWVKAQNSNLHKGNEKNIPTHGKNRQSN